MYIHESRVKPRENCVIRAAESELFIKRATHLYLMLQRYDTKFILQIIFYFFHGRSDIHKNLFRDNSIKFQNDHQSDAIFTSDNPGICQCTT